HDQSVLVKGDFLYFDGMSEADKVLMEINNIHGIKEYQDEDDAMFNDELLPMSYTELLHTGQSKRVLANKDLDTSVETSSSKVIDMDSYTLEDMEIILLVYTKKRKVNEMYFLLQKVYLNLKKEDITFKAYTKDLKNPDSHLM
ncbi:hypothetical protein GOP47_0020818, partial [Adiantum capillus-veneris]